MELTSWTPHSVLGDKTWIQILKGIVRLPWDSFLPLGVIFANLFKFLRLLFKWKWWASYANISGLLWDSWSNVRALSVKTRGCFHGLWGRKDQGIVCTYSSNYFIDYLKITKKPQVFWREGTSGLTVRKKSETIWADFQREGQLSKSSEVSGPRSIQAAGEWFCRGSYVEKVTTLADLGAVHPLSHPLSPVFITSSVDLTILFLVSQLRSQAPQRPRYYLHHPLPGFRVAHGEVCSNKLWHCPVRSVLWMETCLLCTCNQGTTLSKPWAQSRSLENRSLLSFLLESWMTVLCVSLVRPGKEPHWDNRVKTPVIACEVQGSLHFLSLPYSARPPALHTESLS